MEGDSWRLHIKSENVLLTFKKCPPKISPPLAGGDSPC